MAETYDLAEKADSIEFVTPPSTPRKAKSTVYRKCGCDCDCWQHPEYYSLAPRKAGWHKNKTESGQNIYHIGMLCKHFASCRLSGTSCSLE
jgi:hypothetical protein